MQASAPARGTATVDGHATGEEVGRMTKVAAPHRALRALVLTCSAVAVATAAHLGYRTSAHAPLPPAPAVPLRPLATVPCATRSSAAGHPSTSEVHGTAAPLRPRGLLPHARDRAAARHRAPFPAPRPPSDVRRGAVMSTIVGTRHRTVRSEVEHVVADLLHWRRLGVIVLAVDPLDDRGARIGVHGLHPLIGRLSAPATRSRSSAGRRR
jgi:hypothetical protein